MKWQGFIICDGQSPSGVIVKVLDCALKISKFRFQLPYYVHFQINTLQEWHEPLYPQSYGLNRTTVVLQQGWLWH